MSGVCGKCKHWEANGGSMIVDVEAANEHPRIGCCHVNDGKSDVVGFAYASEAAGCCPSYEAGEYSGPSTVLCALTQAKPPAKAAKRHG